MTTTLDIKRLNTVREEIESYLSVGPLHILEVESHVGFITPILAHKKYSALIIDESERRIREATALLNEEQHSYIKTQHCNISMLNDEVKYNVIFTSLSFDDDESIATQLQMYYDLLEDGGRLIIVEMLTEPKASAYAQHYHLKKTFSIEQLTHDLIQANFLDVTGRKFYSGYEMVDDFKCPYSLFSICGKK